MKKYILGLSMLLFMGVSGLKAQETQTLFDGDITHGGFGGPMIKFEDIKNDLGVWVGGRGGWIINTSDRHAISFGGGGYGLATNHQNIMAESEEDMYAATGYGGFITEYTNRSYQVVHVTATGLIGAGGFSLRDRDFEDIDEEPQAYFVMEPGIHVEVNVTTFFRIAAGVNYRYTSGISKGDFRDSDFTGANATITFKFGFFT